jgi:hypothetical protein
VERHPDEFDAEGLDVTDPVTGRARVCAAPCHSCVLHPDESKRLIQDPGTLQEFLDRVVAEDSYVICHGTVPGLELGEGTPPAICAGFMARRDDEERDEPWRQSWRARAIVALGGGVQVPPPRKTAVPDEAAAA